MLVTLKKISKYKKTLSFFLVILVCLVVVSFGYGYIIEKIDAYSIGDVYKAIVKRWPSLPDLIVRSRFPLILIFLFIAILRLYKPILFTIRHTSFSCDLAPVDTGQLKEYWLKKINLDLTQELKYPGGIAAALGKQSGVVRKIKGSRIPFDGVCYYGIAHTPFIFHLGFLFGDQSNVRFFHKLRDGKSGFTEWDDGGSQIAIGEILKRERATAEELVLSISTSMEILETDLASLNPHNKHILMLQTNQVGFDNITRYQNAESLRNQIMILVRKFVKNNRVNRIHLVLSSSASFTFFLAQGFSTQHDPEIVVYHCERDHYPWGICVNNPLESAFINNCLDNPGGGF